MNKIYVAKDGERLDSIVYRHYGHLRFFEEVLKLNHKLAPVLKAGDRVFLPDINENVAKKEKTLW